MNLRLLKRTGLTLMVCVGASGFFMPAWAATGPGAAPAAAARPADPVVRSRGPRAGGAVAVRSTSIMGVAWNADNSPIPGARLRLRNATTGRIAGTALANEAGQFTFGGIETGSYLVELVSESGRILTISHTFAVGPGETVATFVRLGSKAPWFSGFFGNAASAVAATAASAGVTAIAPEAKPCSSPSPGCS
jgi:hypothetical protein